MRPIQLARIVETIREWAVQERIFYTPKAAVEMRDLGVSKDDVREVLIELSVEEFFREIRSRLSGERLYEFKISLVGTPVYCKIALRTLCVLISFHEDEDEE